MLWSFLAQLYDAYHHKAQPQGCGLKLCSLSKILKIKNKKSKKVMEFPIFRYHLNNEGLLKMWGDWPITILCLIGLRACTMDYSADKKKLRSRHVEGNCPSLHQTRICRLKSLIKIHFIEFFNLPDDTY